MPAFIPAGMVPLHVALGQAARAWLPEPWARLKDEDRELFAASSDGDWRRARFRPAHSVGEEAYSKLRPFVADGVLPTLMRVADRGPVPVASEAWTSRSADSLLGILGGTALLKLVEGESTAGPILLWTGDLDAVLRGEPAPSLRAPGPVAAVQAATALPSPAPRRRAGRPTNPEGDDFWIEVVQRMMAGAVQAGQAKLTADMAQWCIDHMAAPYDGETVRKKLGRLFGAVAPE